MIFFMLIVNFFVYCFVSLDDLFVLCECVLVCCEVLVLKGMILLVLEGINLFLVGLCEVVDVFMYWLCEDLCFVGLEVKELLLVDVLFGCMCVWLKKEIIIMC